MDEVRIRNYIVAFIDLLGQREQMKDILFMPPVSDEEGRNNFRDKIFKSIEAVLFVQNNFSNSVEISNERHKTKIEGVEESIREQCQPFRKTKVQTQRFSDGLVLFSPLNDEDHFPLSSVSTILYSCASMMIVALDRGFPFRAGIAIGAGCCVNDCDIYGPVLAEAYRLESEVAKYVRVVVSDAILDWFSSFEYRKYNSPQEKIVTLEMRDMCNEIFMRDKDGVLTLDFLNQTSINTLGGIENFSAPIKGMGRFVKKMLHVFRNEPHILEKYEWLDEYIKSRVIN